MSRLAVGILAALLMMAVWSAPLAAAAYAQDPTTAPPTQTVPITVVNTKEPVITQSAPTPPLASTGSDIISLLETGIALVAAGLFVMAVARRKMVTQ